MRGFAALGERCDGETCVDEFLDDRGSEVACGAGNGDFLVGHWESGSEKYSGKVLRERGFVVGSVTINAEQSSPC